ncbi:MAG: flagellar basal body P-ring formation protein FlgA [Caulobacteraceae bacterium]|nr:flagellar basal body P-ring formation protein FlgA [Caulobacteraceae bacterium]
MRACLPVLSAALIALAGAAVAGQPVSLNPAPVDSTGKVTLGELFDDAGAARDVVVAARLGPSVVLDAAAVQALARRYGLDWGNPTGLRRIIVRGAGAADAVAGRNVEILAYARNLAAGEIVQAQDIVWTKAAAQPVDTPHDPDAVIGMAARRPLRQGEAVETRDLSAPIVIKAGDTISVTYADGGVTLTLQARAMANASVGQSLSVLNPVSKKVIEAVAAGPGAAVVGPEALRLKSEHAPDQLALR